MNELKKEQFVMELKEIIRNSVKSRMEFFSDESKLKPEGYLANLSNLYRNLSEGDKKLFKVAIQIEAECNGLYMLLALLDHYISKGELRLSFVKENDEVRLNSPDEKQFTEIFNLLQHHENLNNPIRV